ncbi:DUF998 domain-containing protein [Micromonospora sp. DR5-3]|uniref:DUF998 domain-containing protein n=1 Tax=unclassified Micromonospora TaxID=2617518 RepID=UPI0011D37CF2|nr:MULTISPECIES: DUF998 domain-containing protein [unclassified Micromonospora]MCW3815318.1 DUF998 domain-containing protein [Micromonospora sp. DR5-3]TYC22590.1 DUF998 domain-containing protein [Micromonospora sp. MP36]
MPGNRRSALLALGGIALAAVLAVLGHLQVNDDLSPWSLTVSDFAVSDRGGVIDVAMAVLAAATAVLIPVVWRTGAGSDPSGSRPGGKRRAPTGGEAPGRIGRRPRVAGVLLAAWTAGLVTSAVVPTNEPGLPMGTAAYLHRYASVVAFLALPVAGWLLAGHLGSRAAGWLRALTLASLLLAGAMIWSAYPGDRMLIGLAERLLIVTEVALLSVLAVALTRRPAGRVAETVPATAAATAPPAARELQLLASE